MNDELTLDERAALRARIVGGARGIRPAGAHRNAWIAGSVAVALVVAIAGGVVATSTLSAPPIAMTPTPSPTSTPTSTRTPTPTPTPTPSPTAPAVAFGGDCDAVLTEDRVSSIVGVAMELSNGVRSYDAGVIGGIDCLWRATGDGYQAVQVLVVPFESVPQDMRPRLGELPECRLDVSRCEWAMQFGDAVVVMSASRTEELTALADAIGDRAALSPGKPRSLPAGSWTVPDCADIRDIVNGARGREDIVEYAGDNVPSGSAWEVLSRQGVVVFCPANNSSAPRGTPQAVDFFFGPGSSPDLEAVRQHGGTAVEVAGADAAWYFPERTPHQALLLVQSGSNVMTVGARSLTEDEMAQAAAAIIAALG